jgi:predicted nucleic acid-binding protein
VTATKVVDASALAAVLLDETTADSVAARLEKQQLLAPALLPFEMVSVCWKKAKKYPEKIDLFLAAIDRFCRIPIVMVEVDFRAILPLALRHRLTTYDASYLWLALEMDAELVTLDAELGRAYDGAMHR